MKKILLVVMILLVVNPKFVYAGRGCCSHHGGQNYCGSDGYWYCNDGSRSPTCRCSGENSSSTSSSSNTYRYQKQEIYGCTDKNAYNYNSSATKNDGSCIEKVYGCMIISAINYNEKANTKDGSCQFQEIKTETKKIKYKTKKKYSFWKKKEK